MSRSIFQTRVLRRRFLTGFLTLVLIGCSLISWSESSDPEKDVIRILVRDVHLIDPNSQENEVAVDILISGGILKNITADDIDPGDVDLIIEGENRIVLGIFDLGKEANFLLLDDDPRSNPEIVFDTKAHTIFSMRHGKILRNMMPVNVPLPEITPEEQDLRASVDTDKQTEESKKTKTPEQKKKPHH